MRREYDVRDKWIGLSRYSARARVVIPSAILIRPRCGRGLKSILRRDVHVEHTLSIFKDARMVRRRDPYDTCPVQRARGMLADDLTERPHCTAVSFHKVCMAYAWNIKIMNGEVRERKGFTLGGDDAGAKPEDGPARAAARGSLGSALYKHHVDALFEDAGTERGRSPSPLLRSDGYNIEFEVKGTGADSTDDDDYCRSRIHSMSNAVQQRIQRMFAELADEATPAQYALPPFCRSLSGPYSSRTQDHQLNGLQTPPRSLPSTPPYAAPFYPPARLEISGGGFEETVPTVIISIRSPRSRYGPQLFVVQPLDATETDGSGWVCLPTAHHGSEAVDRQALFRPLTSTESRLLLESDTKPPRPEPLFTVVMRRTASRAAWTAMRLMSQQRRCDRNCRDALQSVNGT
ncbi:hypothetical protein EVAR_87111_1 [Eumeta japonica]|uniref:Uncharacterized protein n=1 Tax=Eumeta variegata TaxID=151549 RepID=A0A4C1ZYR9_EUMVA|nr:hypothetical protein EVAR_87111_1 [Eumeta japonica]